MRDKRQHLIKVLVLLSVVTLVVAEIIHHSDVFASHDQAGDIEQVAEIAPPFDCALKYPFTESNSRKSGRWRSHSLDYPYFGAPRGRKGRRHAAIDLYPITGTGTPVHAIQDGTIVKIAPFYRRRNGEITYAVLIDHKEFVANYAELIKPTLVTGAAVKKEQIIGFVSGTKQLHFGLYKPGTTNWVPWYGKMPPNLIDPTDVMMRVFSGEQ